jgi:hypothetical protein
VISNVEVRLGLDMDVALPSVLHVSEVLPHAVAAVVDAAHDRERRVELDARIAGGDERLDVARVVRLQDAAMELGVALRHACSPRRFSVRRVALRREAVVGERALAVPVMDDPGHLAAADVE